MARPVRLEFGGALYHVTARGDRREAIYRRTGSGSLTIVSRTGSGSLTIVWRTGSGSLTTVLAKRGQVHLKEHGKPGWRKLNSLWRGFRTPWLNFVRPV